MLWFGCEVDIASSTPPGQFLLVLLQGVGRGGGIYDIDARYVL